MLSALALALLPMETHAEDRVGLPARTVELGEGVRLQLASEAEVGVPRGMQLPVGRGSALVRVQSIPVVQGRVEMTVDGELGTRGGMLTFGPKFLAVCTGGRMTVVVEPDAVVTIAHDHDLLLGYGGRFRPLPVGHYRRYDRTTGTSTDGVVLPAPRTDARPPLQSALEGPVTVALPVSPVPGAERYVVRLTTPGNETSLAEESFVEAQTVRVTPPGPGRYRARLFAVDAVGIESPPSPPIDLRVLGIVDRERLVHAGSIHVEPGERVRVLGAEGLVLRYGASSEFVPAMSTIGLPQREATRVEFRDPLDPKSIVVFPLMPERQRIKIELGKATTEWPRDSLPIRIRFDGPRGPALLGSYRPEVLVNLTPVDLEFVEKDGSLFAELAPQPGPGPWVVRVNLRNDKGAEVARNFLEVTEERSTLPRERAVPVASGRTERKLRRVE